MTTLIAPVPGATTIAPERVVTDADVLERAADLLEEFGWCQGAAARDEAGKSIVGTWERAVSFCHNGAIYRAACDLGVSSSLFDGRWERLIGDSDAHLWNDVPGRTKQEVVARLRDAAATARETS